MENAEVEGPHYTSDPETIRALPEEERTDAIRDIFRQASERYIEAVARDDAKSAQESAIAAIAVIAGLFEPGDPANRLIMSLIAANFAARSGSKNHILLRPGARVPGTKGGLNVATIAAAGVAAVAFLERRGMTTFAARKAVAIILAEHGLSRKRGEHGEPKPITVSALRGWAEKPDDYPLVEALSPIHLESLERNALPLNIRTAEEALKFLRNQAAEHVPIMFAI